MQQAVKPSPREPSPIKHNPSATQLYVKLQYGQFWVNLAPISVLILKRALAHENYTKARKAAPLPTVTAWMAKLNSKL